MKSEAVRMAEIKANSEMFQELLRNPVVELLAGIIVIQLLNKGDKSILETLTGVDVKTVVEGAGLVTIIGLQQLGPQGIQAVAGFTGAGLSALGKAIPLLAAGG